MRAVVQRVRAGSVEVDGEMVGSIARGLVCFVGAETGDGPDDVAFTVKKILSLRIFPDEAGKMQHDVRTIDGAVLVVSQFTLFADLSRGNRPSFTDAAPPELARALVDDVARAIGEAVAVATGRFGADMRVRVDNDGPVTIQIDSRSRSKKPVD